MAANDYEVLDERFRSCFNRTAHVDRLWIGGRWTEGPVYFPAARHLQSLAATAGLVPSEVHTAWGRALDRLRQGSADDEVVVAGEAPPPATRRRRRSRRGRRRR